MWSTRINLTLQDQSTIGFMIHKACLCTTLTNKTNLNTKGLIVSCDNWFLFIFYFDFPLSDFMIHEYAKSDLFHPIDLES